MILNIHMHHRLTDSMGWDCFTIPSSVKHIKSILTSNTMKGEKHKNKFAMLSMVSQGKPDISISIQPKMEAAQVPVF